MKSGAMTLNMHEVTLRIPVQETGDVGLSVEDSLQQESKPSSVDSVHYVTSTGSSEVHNSPPSQACKETQTNFVPEKNDPKPEVKYNELEDITPPGSSDIMDQQKTPPGDERRDEKKRRRKRKKRPVIQGREMVSPLVINPKTQSQDPSRLYSTMASDIFSKLAVRVIFFVFLFGIIQGAPRPLTSINTHPTAVSSSSTTRQWKVHSFAVKSSLCNVHLSIRNDDYVDAVCKMPQAICFEDIICGDNESWVSWINSTFLLLFTKNQSHPNFLEYGSQEAATSVFEGSFDTLEEAVEHSGRKKKAPQIAKITKLVQNSTPNSTTNLAPRWASLLATILILAVLLGIGIFWKNIRKLLDRLSFRMCLTNANPLSGRQAEEMI
ncbi:uncharacterized protein LOC134965849 isoform X2 [Pseudophryne corroboree]|uniref:uncharacterized protein LOC134965849 isoform X2 n=1 Tax=Pseudophryne corroboree TaxID=495146 RepID=UPI003081F8F5